jgi:RNA-directed DNA polymerase
MDKKIAGRLIIALRYAALKAKENNWSYWVKLLEAKAAHLELHLEIEGLEQIRPVMKALLGYDPLAGDTRPKGEKQPGLARSEAQEAPSLQDLRRKIYIKAKAEPAKRFWGLFVHVTKLETLREAYQLAKANNGAPGIDGVTFEAIEESGVEEFLQVIRDELVAGRYRPMRNRKKEIPKDGGKKVRVLSIPSIRDRVVQGALKLILEPIFEADFQPGSFGYRPKRTAHEAVYRVQQATLEGKTRVMDLDLRAYFDNVRHHTLLEKVARRVEDSDVMRLLKLILTAGGKKGVPQGGVISPLLSNLYLNEVDKMLERAKEVTREGGRTRVEYARYADDLVVLVDSEPRSDWLLKALDRRLREEFAKLQVEVNEEKTRTVELAAGDSFNFLGFTYSRNRSARGRWWTYYRPQSKKRTALLRRLKEVFRGYRSQPVGRIVAIINPILRGWVAYFRIGNASKCFRYVRLWVEKKVRRHLMRARKRGAFGWKRWSTKWLEETVGLYADYGIRPYQPPRKALATR